MRTFTKSARRFVEDNWYGPREARFAATLLLLNAQVETSRKVLTERQVAAETQLATASARIEVLSKMLRKASKIISEHTVGHEDDVRRFTKEADKCPEK